MKILIMKNRELQGKVGSSQNLSELSVISELQPGMDSRSSTTKRYFEILEFQGLFFQKFYWSWKDQRKKRRT